MYENDCLSENAYFTGLKCLVPMFAFLILLAWPLLQSTIGGQMQAISAEMSAMAQNATTAPLSTPPLLTKMSEAGAARVQ